MPGLLGSSAPPISSSRAAEFLAALGDWTGLSSESGAAVGDWTGLSSESGAAVGDWTGSSSESGAAVGDWTGSSTRTRGGPRDPACRSTEGSAESRVRKPFSSSSASPLARPTKCRRPARYPGLDAPDSGELPTAITRVLTHEIMMTPPIPPTPGQFRLETRSSGPDARRPAVWTPRGTTGHRNAYRCPLVGGAVDGHISGGVIRIPAGVDRWRVHRSQPGGQDLTEVGEHLCVSFQFPADCQAQGA